VFVLIVLLAFAGAPAPARSQTAPSSTSLDKLVAPIALYPDPLVAQILPASTYPVQVIEAERALASGERPSKATASQWDPAVQALLSFPTVLKMMSDKINWTTELGQAVAANQGEVLAAIQHVRQEAHDAGNLASNTHQTVTVQGSGSTSTIIIQPANPQVIYVPQYNPVSILAPAPYYGYAWGAPAYPLMTFGLGFAAGAATAYACNWGHYGGYGSVTVNNNYHYSATNNYAHYSSTAYHGSQYSSWHPPASSDVGRSTDDYRASQYHPSAATGGYHGDLASGERFGGNDLAGGSGRGAGGSLGDTGRLGGGFGDGGSRGGFGGWNSGGRGFGGGGFGGFGGGAFRGVDGGGWGARDASSRGFESFGGRSFGGFGGFGGFRGGGFRGGFRR
jgi:hypothetical protein